MDSPAEAYTFSFEANHQQVDRIHAYLTCSYWAEGIPLPIVQRAIDHSLCLGGFHDGLQIAFARVVTDRTTFAYLCDVYVLEEHRGRGIALKMMRTLLAHADLQGLRRFTLATRDAHALYAQLGFTAVAKPASYMEILRPNIYRTK